MPLSMPSTVPSRTIPRTQSFLPLQPNSLSQTSAHRAHLPSRVVPTAQEQAVRELMTLGIVVQAMANTGQGIYAQNFPPVPVPGVPLDPATLRPEPALIGLVRVNPLTPRPTQQNTSIFARLFGFLGRS